MSKRTKITTKAADVLNDFVDDIVAGRVPRAYTRMAEALGLEVDTLLELIPLFDCAERVETAARYRPQTELTPSSNGENQRGDPVRRARTGSKSRQGVSGDEAVIRKGKE